LTERKQRSHEFFRAYFHEFYPPFTRPLVNIRVYFPNSSPPSEKMEIRQEKLDTGITKFTGLYTRVYTRQRPELVDGFGDAARTM
jgi:hypothetical protein